MPRRATNSRAVTLGLVQMRCGDRPGGQPRQGGRAHRSSAARRGAESSACRSCSARSTSARREDAARFRAGRADPRPEDRRARPRSRERIGVVIVASLFERRARGLYHNTAVVIDADGSLARHLPQDAHSRRSALLREVLLHARRSRLPELRARATRKIGALVCWDQWFPEAARLTALARRARSSSIRRRSAGIRARRRSSARRSTRRGRPSQRSHAIANGVFVAVANRVGGEGNLEFWGASFVADPFGRVLARASHDREETWLVPLRSRAASTRRGATGRSCATAASMRTPGSDSARLARLNDDERRDAALPRALGYPHAGGMGAARRDLAVVAAQGGVVAGQAAIRSRDLGRDGAALAPHERGPHPRQRRRGGDRWRGRRCAHEAATPNVRFCIASRPTTLDARSWADVRPAGAERRAGARSTGSTTPGAASIRLGSDDAVPRGSTRTLRRARSSSPGSSSKAARSTSTAAARCSPPRRACSTRIAIPAFRGGRSRHTCATTSVCRHILWLGDGIVGDDTDGHVDDLTRFVDPSTVVTVVEDDPADENHRPLHENYERLRSMTDDDGPAPRGRDAADAAAVYYEANACRRATPTSTSATAWCWCRSSATRATTSRCETLPASFPDGASSASPSTDLVWGLGAFHCVTQQQPAAPIRVSR